MNKLDIEIFFDSEKTVFQINNNNFVDETKQQNSSSIFNPEEYLKEPIDLNHLVNIDEKCDKLGQTTESESFKLSNKKRWRRIRWENITR